MTYHKRAATAQRCAHCRTEFLSTHKSRLYCCQSCNTLAWRARHARASGPGRAKARATLAFDAQNVALLTLGSAVGTFAAQGVTALGQQLLATPSELDVLRAEMRAGFAALRGAPLAAQQVQSPPAAAPWLPVALAALRTPLVTLHLQGLAPAAYVRLPYHGHTLYHQLDTGLVLWERTPGQYRALASLAALAELAGRPAPPTRQAAATLPAPLPLADREWPALPVPSPEELAAAAAEELAQQQLWDQCMHEHFSAPAPVYEPLADLDWEAPAPALPLAALDAPSAPAPSPLREARRAHRRRT